VLREPAREAMGNAETENAAKEKKSKYHYPPSWKSRTKPFIE
jgi:hypothetical protein